jgi:hypothetical protein
MLCGTTALAEKPLIAVVPFNGPQAKAAEAVVVRSLRRKAVLIPTERWQASARKLFANTLSPDDISAVASDLGARLVVTGVVKRDGRAWQLVVSVRDGKSGRTRDRLKYPLKAPRLPPQVAQLLANEIMDAFDHALGPEAGAPEAPAPPARPAPPSKPAPAAPPRPAPPPAEAEEKPTPPPSRRTKPPAAPPPETEAPAAEAPAAAPAPSREEEAPPLGEPARKPAEKAAEGGRRPRWAPYFDVSAGGSVSGRAFDFVPASLPRFSSGVVGGVVADLSLYPLAGTWRSARGVFAGLGIGATLNKPFWPASQAPDMNTYATDELRVEGGIRWHIVLHKALPRPELLLRVEGGYHTFTIAKMTDPVTGLPTDVGPPDVATVFVSYALGLRLWLAEWSRLWASFSYQLLLDAGPIVTAQEYGPATAYGLNPSGGLDFFLYRGLKLALKGYYERISYSFVPSNPPPQKPGMGTNAQSAVDQYFGGSLSIGYEY